MCQDDRYRWILTILAAANGGKLTDRGGRKRRVRKRPPGARRPVDPTLENPYSELLIARRHLLTFTIAHLLRRQ